MVINLDITYTEAQYEVFFEAKEKRRVVQKGGRVGMTQGGAMAMAQMCLESDKPLLMLWGDETLGNVRKYIDKYFMPVLKKVSSTGGSIWHYNKQDMELRINQSVIHFRSADRPERWEGFGYHFIFLNEAGLILRKNYIWEQSVQKMLLDFEDSVMVAAGVPKGINMFTEMIEWGNDPTMPEWKTYRYSTYANPFIPIKGIDELVKRSPDIAKQEVFGEILGAEDNAFQFIQPDWVEMAFNNWRMDSSLPGFSLPKLTSVGGDPSRGRDECCLTYVHDDGNTIYIPQQFIIHGEKADTTHKVSGAWSKGILLQSGEKQAQDVKVPVRIDTIGLGYGVFDMLDMKGKNFPNVIGLMGGKKVSKKSANRLYKIGKENAWWWWFVRELMDPSSPKHRRMAICPDPILKMQLCSVRFEIRSGIVYREDKKLTKERLGGKNDKKDNNHKGVSPDRGESCVYALCDQKKRGKVSW